MKTKPTKITRIEASEAERILKCAFENGVTDQREAKNPIVLSDFEFLLRVEPVHLETEPWLVLVNKPWNGLVYDERTGSIGSRLDDALEKPEVVRAWINRDFPVEARPQLTEGEVRYLLHVTSCHPSHCDGSNGLNRVWSVQDEDARIARNFCNIQSADLADKLLRMSVSERESLSDAIACYRCYANGDWHDKDSLNVEGQSWPFFNICEEGKVG